MSCCTKKKKQLQVKNRAKSLPRFSVWQQTQNWRFSRQEFESIKMRYLNMENEEKQGMDKQSFLDSMGLLGLPSTQLLGERMYEVMDEHNKGSVSFREFLSFMDVLYHGTNDQKAEMQFKMLDKNKNRKINLEEFEQFMLSLTSMASNIYGSKFDVKKKKQEIAYLFNLADQNKDGLVDISEFKVFWNKHPEYTDFMNIITKGIQNEHFHNQGNSIAIKKVKNLLNEIQICKELVDNSIVSLSTYASQNFSPIQQDTETNQKQTVKQGFNMQQLKQKLQECYPESAQRLKTQQKEGPNFSTIQPTKKYGEDSFDSLLEGCLDDSIIDLIIEVKETENSEQQVGKVFELQIDQEEIPSSIKLDSLPQQSEDSFEEMLNQNRKSLEVREQVIKVGGNSLRNSVNIVRNPTNVSEAFMLERIKEVSVRLENLQLQAENTVKQLQPQDINSENQIRISEPRQTKYLNIPKRSRTIKTFKTKKQKKVKTGGEIVTFGDEN